MMSATSASAALRCVAELAPFGDIPDSESAPFSAAQLSAYLNAKTTSSPLPPRAVCDTLSAVKARTVRGIERRLRRLGAHLDGELEFHGPFVRLPGGLRSVLHLRYLSALACQLSEARLPSEIVDAKAVAPALLSLSQCAERCLDWQALLGPETSAYADSEDEHEWPDAFAWSQAARRAARYKLPGVSSSSYTLLEHDSHVLDVAGSQPAHGGLKVDLRIDKKVGCGKRRAVGKDNTPGHWEASIRLELVASPAATTVSEPSVESLASISRVTLSEDVRSAWPEHFVQLAPVDAARLERLATRDISFSPPLILRRPGSSAHIVIKLARLSADENVAPNLRVSVVAAI
jgi:hypothetical protein